MPISVIPISQKAMVSTLVIDADLDLGTTYKLIAPAIQASATGTLYLKDNGGVNRVGLIGAGFHVNDLYEFTAGADIDFNNNIDITGKSIVGFAPAAPAAGTTLAFSFTDERYTSSGSYNRKMPQVMIARTGVIRVGYLIKSDGGGYHQIMKNGVAVTAAVWINNAVYQAYHEDVNVSAGDIIHVEINKSVANTYIDNFYVGITSDPLGLVVMVAPDVASS